MSLPIWTPDALSSEQRRYEGSCWRFVEAQHRVSTLKVVDTLEEQALLEDIIEETKQAVPPECRHLYYLLSTPFRYTAPYPHGSRFRRAGWTAGVYYASETPETALAEMVFYRFLFFAESPGTSWPDNAAEYTAFSADVATDSSIDLTEPLLSRDEVLWMHPTDYAACQSLADTAREADTRLIRYRSVRDPDTGCNLAVLTCDVFRIPQPVERQTWKIRLSDYGAQALCEYPRQSLEYRHDAFDDPRLNAFKPS